MMRLFDGMRYWAMPDAIATRAGNRRWSAAAYQGLRFPAVGTLTP